MSSKIGNQVIITLANELKGPFTDGVVRLSRENRFMHSALAEELVEFLKMAFHVHLWCYVSGRSEEERRVSIELVSALYNFIEMRCYTQHQGIVAVVSSFLPDISAGIIEATSSDLDLRYSLIRAALVLVNSPTTAETARCDLLRSLKQLCNKVGTAGAFFLLNQCERTFSWMLTCNSYATKKDASALLLILVRQVTGADNHHDKMSSHIINALFSGLKCSNSDDLDTGYLRILSEICRRLTKLGKDFSSRFEHDQQLSYKFAVLSIGPNKELQQECMGLHMCILEALMSEKLDCRAYIDFTQLLEVLDECTNPQR